MSVTGVFSAIFGLVVPPLIYAAASSQFSAEADPLVVRIFVLVLVAWFLYITVANSLTVLLLPMRGTLQPIITLAILAFIAVPVSFAALFQGFERTGNGECIANIGGTYDALHFSYTTLTTLGYGDLQPVGYCRIFTAVESISGYLILGILIGLSVKLFQEKEEDTLRKREKAHEDFIWSEIEKKFDLVNVPKNLSDEDDQ